MASAEAKRKKRRIEREAKLAAGIEVKIGRPRKPPLGTASSGRVADIQRVALEGLKRAGGPTFSSAYYERQARELSRIDTLTAVANEAWSEARIIRNAKLQENAIDFGPVNCVYFIRMGETAAFKIGMATNGLDRFKSHQVSSPVDLDMTAFVCFVSERAMIAAETAAHRLAGSVGMRPLRGEWFKGDQNMVDRLIEDLVEISGDKVFAVFRKGVDCERQ